MAVVGEGVDDPFRQIYYDVFRPPQPMMFVASPALVSHGIHEKLPNLLQFIEKCGFGGRQPRALASTQAQHGILGDGRNSVQRTVK